MSRYYSLARPELVADLRRHLEDTKLEELELPEEPVLELLNSVSMAKRMANMVRYSFALSAGGWTIADLCSPFRRLSTPKGSARSRRTIARRTMLPRAAREGTLLHRLQEREERPRARRRRVARRRRPEGRRSRVLRVEQRE